MAYEFDGIDDFLIVPHHNDLNFDLLDDFAVSLWVRADSLQKTPYRNANVIMSKWIDQSGAGTNEGYPYTIYG